MQKEAFLAQEDKSSGTESDGDPSSSQLSVWVAAAAE